MVLSKGKTASITAAVLVALCDAKPLMLPAGLMASTQNMERAYQTNVSHDLYVSKTKSNGYNTTVGDAHAYVQDVTNKPFRNKKRPLVTYHFGRDAEREMLLRMCVAIACGAIIGMERRAASANAGVRTLSLVSLGSAIFTLTALLSFSGDSSRVGAAISTGIGFLGAGAINQNATRSASQRQLVTAASIWIAAALGVAAASGLKSLALLGSLVTVWILRWTIIMRYIRLISRRKLPLLMMRLRSQRSPRNFP